MGKTIGILGCVCLLFCGSVLYGQSRSSAINGSFTDQPLEKVLKDLKRSYKSTVDPRLNYEQSLEMAMLIVEKHGRDTA